IYPVHCTITFHHIIYHFFFFLFFFNHPPTTEIYTLSLHDALPIWMAALSDGRFCDDGHDHRLASHHFRRLLADPASHPVGISARSEEHTSELQSRGHLVCRLLLEKKKNKFHTRGVIHRE